jgi:hypothetical protein
VTNSNMPPSLKATIFGFVKGSETSVKKNETINFRANEAEYYPFLSSFGILNDYLDA